VHQFEKAGLRPVRLQSFNQTHTDAATAMHRQTRGLVQRQQPIVLEENVGSKCPCRVRSAAGVAMRIGGMRTLFALLQAVIRRTRPMLIRTCRGARGDETWVRGTLCRS
jgi:hypothetical protein